MIILYVLRFLKYFDESLANDIQLLMFTGAWTDMPAVREFALYAAMAVLFDFILQVTCFVSLMTIDAKRQEVQCSLRSNCYSNIDKSDCL